MLYQFVNGSLGTESILECDALNILDAFQKFLKGNVTLFVTRYLGTNAVVCYRAIHDVVIMQSPTIGICSMVINEVCPLFSIILKPLYLKLLEKRLVKPIYVDYRGGIFKFCILYAVLGGIVCFVFA